MNGHALKTILLEYFVCFIRVIVTALLEYINLFIKVG